MHVSGLKGAEKMYLPQAERRLVRDSNGTVVAASGCNDDFVKLQPDAALEYAANSLQNIIRNRNGTYCATYAKTSGGKCAAEFVFEPYGKVERVWLFAPTQHAKARRQYVEDKVEYAHRWTQVVPERLSPLLCILHRSDATELLQHDLTNLNSDQASFPLLQCTYANTRGRRKRSMSLKCLRSIKFVQLKVFKSALVNIQRRDVIPPEERRDEHRYGPIPVDLIPPIEKNLTLHLCTLLQCADESCFLLEARVYTNEVEGASIDMPENRNRPWSGHESHRSRHFRKVNYFDRVMITILVVDECFELL